MKAEDIRRLYRTESPATEEEARATLEQALGDPEQACQMFAALTALATNEGGAFAALMSNVLSGALVGLIQERMASDDAYALQIMRLIVSVQNAMAPPPKTPRGKQARSA